MVVLQIYLPVTGQRQTPTVARSTHFYCNSYFLLGGIRTCVGVSMIQSMFLRISSNSCPLNLPLVRSHQAEITIVKRHIQGRNNVTRMRVEPTLHDHSLRKNDVVSFSTRLRIRFLRNLNSIIWYKPTNMGCLLMQGWLLCWAICVFIDKSIAQVSITVSIFLCFRVKKLITVKFIYFCFAFSAKLQ